MKGKPQSRNVRNVRKVLALTAPDAFNSIAKAAHRLESIERIRAFLRDDGAGFDSFTTELTIEGHSFTVQLPRAQVLREINNLALAERGLIADLLRAAG